MRQYKTIYGESIVGEIVKQYKHTVIVQTTNGGNHMVHKKSFDPEYQAKKTDAERKTTTKHFNLEKTQARGPLRNDMRHWTYK